MTNTVYDHASQEISIDGEITPFDSGSYDFPCEAIILLKFKKGELSLQEAYHLLKYDPSLYFV